MSHNFKLKIAYDGTAYCGWQIQPNGITIQAILQEKIELVLGQPITLIGSGRTDSGVHALGQIAHFHFPTEIASLLRFQHSLNALLPGDIRILEIQEAPLDFHAQHSAKGKIYHYNLQLDQVQDPFKRLYNLHIREEIDLELMHKASQFFIGTHDFTSFANEAHSGSAAQDAVRTVKRIDIVKQTGGVRLEFEANGFLYKMVRNLTGTLLEVARRKRSVNDMPAILAAKDRRLSGQAAPARGLFLVQVHY